MTTNPIYIGTEGGVAIYAKPGIKQAEVAQELDLTAHTVIKHVKDIRAEWEAKPSRKVTA